MRFQHGSTGLPVILGQLGTLVVPAQNKKIAPCPGKVVVGLGPVVVEIALPGSELW